MNNLLKRPRHNRPNNRVNRNYHPHQHTNNRQHEETIDEHLPEDKRLDYRPARNRVTLQQYVEKFIAQARDAASSGDRVLSENYLQHADHFTRLLNEQKVVRQQIEQKIEHKRQHAERVQTNEQQNHQHVERSQVQEEVVTETSHIIVQKTAEEKPLVIKRVHKEHAPRNKENASPNNVRPSQNSENAPENSESSLRNSEEKPKKRVVRKKPVRPTNEVTETV
jgi:Fe-S cluster biosynthesis and repair protein YggX